MARRHLTRAHETRAHEHDVIEAATTVSAVDSASTSSRTDVVITNPHSGPILVPAHVPLGDLGWSVHPWALGGSTFGWTLNPEQAHAVLDRFAGTGGDLLDTADVYGAGRSESIIGSWMHSRGTRDRMTVMTKVGQSPEHRGLSPDAIAAAVDDSLVRLRTDRIDVLFFHGDDPEVPLEESLGAVDALIRAGKVRAIGASDLPPERLIEARVLAANGLPRFALLTARYNLMERHAFEGAPELVAHAQSLGVLPYAGLASGFLAGAVRRRSEVRHDARGARQARHLTRRGHRVLAALDEIGLAHGVAPATIALAWLLAKPTVVAPVVSATHPEQVEALMAAASVDLQRSQIVDLDRASA